MSMRARLSLGCLVCLGMVVASAEAGQDQIPVTTAPGSSVTFGSPDVPPIPADFFGPGSDPFVGEVVLTGGPGADTSVFYPPLDCPPGPGACTPVPIEIVELSLSSTEPIIVTFNGGQNPEPWDVHVGLTPGTQPPGQLNAVKDHANGGSFDATLPIQPQFTFTRVDPPGTPIDLDVPVIDLGLTGPWVVVADESLDIFAPTNGNFVAGVNEVIPGDPGSQIIDIINGDSEGGVVHNTQPPGNTGIPAVSSWGVAAMMLVLLVAGTLAFQRSRQSAIVEG